MILPLFAHFLVPHSLLSDPRLQLEVTPTIPGVSRDCSPLPPAGGVAPADSLPPAAGGADDSSLPASAASVCSFPSCPKNFLGISAT